MGEQLEERRATLISDALDLPDELDSTEYLRGAKKEEKTGFRLNRSLGWLRPVGQLSASFFLVSQRTLYLSTKRKFGELLNRKGVKRFPTGVHLHPAQHHNDSGHDQSDKAAGVNDDVRVLGLHSIHVICSFFLWRNEGKQGVTFKTKFARSFTQPVFSY